MNTDTDLAASALLAYQTARDISVSAYSDYTGALANSNSA